MSQQPNTKIPSIPFKQTYIANIQQTGTEAPAGVELENSLKIPNAYVRADVGKYSILVEPVSNTTNYHTVLINNNNLSAGAEIKAKAKIIANSLYVIIETKVSGTYTDGMLDNTNIEITRFNK